MRILALMLLLAGIAAGQCPTLSPSSASIGAGGGSGQFTVGAGCAWTASSGNSWIHVTFGQSGGANGGTVGYIVDPGTGRTGTISVNNSVFTIYQGGGSGGTGGGTGGGPCGESITGPTQLLPAEGGEFNVGISTHCQWNASTSVSWISLEATSGTIGTLFFTVAPNPSAALRYGTIYVDGFSVTISQFGTVCSYVVSLAAANVSAPGGNNQITIQTPDWCSWTVQDPVSWITLGVKNGVYSYSTGTLDYTVSVNSEPLPRTATLVIANQQVVITQTGLGANIQGVVNGASFLPGPVAPGELISIFGSALGPAQPVGLQMTTDGHFVTTSLGGTRVLFDGVAAPVTYVSNGQVNAIAPFELGGAGSTQMIVEVQGVASSAVTESVAAASPGIFAVLNQDGSANIPSNTAAVGTVLQVFVTGLGQTVPTGADGLIEGNGPSSPLATVTASIGGVAAPVQYAGSAAGLVAGVTQVNVLVPQGVVPGNAVSLVIAAGHALSPAGFSIAIR